MVVSISAMQFSVIRSGDKMSLLDLKDSQGVVKQSYLVFELGVGPTPILDPAIDYINRETWKELVNVWNRTFRNKWDCTDLHEPQQYNLTVVQLYSENATADVSSLFYMQDSPDLEWRHYVGDSVSITLYRDSANRCQMAVKDMAPAPPLLSLHRHSHPYDYVYRLKDPKLIDVAFFVTGDMMAVDSDEEWADLQYFWSYFTHRAQVLRIVGSGSCPKTTR
ncbi:hypothetical protein SeLEV6574_g04810 [Synchytrium endobioticum]|nr:hypothetical protein SeLEV6574_g04817 [Synchytrium endobioticum]TPX43903.1 hypothetical protein SeLEV6574_g04810 [Synchytrium endobioticum]